MDLLRTQFYWPPNRSYRSISLYKAKSCIKAVSNENVSKTCFSEHTWNVSSGTAQLMEVVRVFGELRKLGWRPRRTIVFASWAAEEYGYLGSYEYVYQNLAKIQHR